jgi:alkanesulfonate monooxygenase SsuD/methylene tetrahydromethanopterin reductase-like flavin-dependent oxidoreductase (luciferase family)
MRIGIGLPAAVPGVDATMIGPWAAHAEQAGFDSVGVIDRLVYDNLEPLTALAAAAATTSQVELVTTVLNAGWRANAVLLGKQIASVEALSGGRLTVGIGLGGWLEDFEASGIPTTGRGAVLDATMATMRAVWAGTIEGQGGPPRSLPFGRPRLLFGGLVPAAFRRAAVSGEGWVAPLMSTEILTAGADAVRDAWAQAAKPGTPRILTGRYVSLGPTGGAAADEYLHHYYGAGYHAARADTITAVDEIEAQVQLLETIGVTDLVLYPCTSDIDQVSAVAEALCRVRSPLQEVTP